MFWLRIYFETERIWDSSLFWSQPLLLSSPVHVPDISMIVDVAGSDNLVVLCMLAVLLAPEQQGWWHSFICMCIFPLGSPNSLLDNKDSGWRRTYAICAAWARARTHYACESDRLNSWICVWRVLYVSVCFRVVCERVQWMKRKR